MSTDPTVFHIDLSPRGAFTILLGYFLPGLLTPILFAAGVLYFGGRPYSTQQLVASSIAAVVFAVAGAMYVFEVLADRREAFVRCDGTMLEFHEGGASICFEIDRLQSAALSNKDECLVLRDDENAADLMRGRNVEELRAIVVQLDAAIAWARGRTPLHQKTQFKPMIRRLQNPASIFDLIGAWTVALMLVAIAVASWFAEKTLPIGPLIVFSSLITLLGIGIGLSETTTWRRRHIPTTIEFTAGELRILESRESHVFQVDQIVDVSATDRNERNEILVRTSGGDTFVLWRHPKPVQEETIEWIRAGLLKARGLADD